MGHFLVLTHTLTLGGGYALYLVWDFVQIVEDRFQIINTTVTVHGEEKTIR